MGVDAQCILARRPEERLINDFAVLQATLRKLATGVAYLLLSWATVVLLGSFVSALKRVDFWLVTAICTSFALYLADLYEYKIGFLLAGGNIYIGLRDYIARNHGVVCSVIVCAILDACLGLLIILLPAAIQILGLVSPLAAILVSLHRLQTLNSYHKAPKLTASLRIFYSLAVAQNALFYLWTLFLLTENRRASAVSRQCGFREKWGGGLVRRYLGETTSICAAHGALPQGTNLITFAVGMLGSESLDDRRSAVRALGTFVVNKVRIKTILLPCRGALANLFEMLEVSSDGETRECAARIAADLAGDLSHIVDQFPTALDRVASLFQLPPSTAICCSSSSASMPLPSAAGRPTATYWGILSFFINIFGYRAFQNDNEEKQDQLDDDVIRYGKPKLLISQGLLIVERLALHQGNCAHICNNHVLLSKITAPLRSHALLDAEYDGDWIDILGRLLSIVARLIRAPGKASRGLCNAIASNTQSVSNLTRVLEDSKFGPVLKTPAIDILAELLASSDSDKSATAGLDIKRFTSRLWGIFLAEVGDRSTTAIEEEERRQQATRLRQKSGEALVQMLSVRNPVPVEMFIQSTSTSSSEQVLELRHVVGQLTDMLIHRKGSRTWATRILECLCSQLSTKHRQLLPRQDVIGMLGKVLQVIPCIRGDETNNGIEVVVGGGAVQNDDENPCSQDQTTGIRPSHEQEEEEQQEENAFVLALLSLIVAICDMVVDAHDFTRATPDTVFDDLVKKLKGIIETSTNRTVECLRTVKLSCQVVISMVQLKPSSTKVFMDHDFKDVLSKSSKSLSDLDNSLMLFCADNCVQVKTTDKPLVSLVEQALELFDKAKEPSNEPP